MIEIYSKDMTRIIGYAISKYRLSFPEDMLREDLEQEVAVGLMRLPHEITAGDIIRHVLWSRYRIWKDAMSRQHPSTEGKYFTPSNDPIYAKESVKKILGVEKLTQQERDFLKLRVSGLDSREIMAKMGLKTRQRFGQIKRVAFNKVREDCAEAKYWSQE
jgi:hypothetical protein